ncbi:MULTISPECIES: hypothetical protein [unclassified Tolypothrix]|nr:MULTISPECIES: hypothetical protein [unclassified Tolypothrix]MBE9083880.1 hypothetical protein [Tolypothrix sp. LEGE 11397]UYD31433.1 hypothetical protein HG267_20075 [Tolypothrix sp. PCC 7601]
MKNSTHKGMEFLGMGNRAWGMAKKLPMPNDGSCFKPGNPSNALPPQCPKRRGGCPSPPTRGWSFPPLSINSL